MAYVIGSDGLKNGIIEDATGVLIITGFYDLSDQVREGHSLRTDVPASAAQFNDPTSNTYAKWNGESWDEITNSKIVSINNHWEVNFNDYKTARVQMYTEMMMAGGFDALSIEEKRIVSAWFIVGVNERNSVTTLEEQIQNGIIYNERSTQARIKRLTAAKTQVFNRLSHDEVITLLEEMNPAKLMYNYIYLGTEGTLEGDMEGLFDYLLARPNTSFSANGLAIKPFIPTGMENMQDFANYLISILKDGNYQ